MNALYTFLFITGFLKVSSQWPQKHAYQRSWLEYVVFEGDA